MAVPLAELVRHSSTYLVEAQGAALANGFSWRELACSGGDQPLVVAERLSPVTGAPYLYVSAGIHGDEPAPPLALLEAWRRQCLSPALSWTIFPLLNPTGFDLGTRENAARVDLNRDYSAFAQPETRVHRAWLSDFGQTYHLCLCLHEDWEAKGFYLYELDPTSHRQLGADLLQAVTAHLPIDLSEEIDGMPASGGRIAPDVSEIDLPDWPEALYLFAHHSRLGYTLETPSSFPLADRVAAQLAALGAVQSWAQQTLGAATPG